MLKISIKHFLHLFLFLYIFLWPQVIFAVSSPILTSPPDEEKVSKSPKLTWDYVGECVESGSCFKVEVDDNSDFSSPKKSTYSDKNYYSPQGLTETSWYWRVKAKDKSGNWSEWSKFSSFTISLNSETASPPGSTPTPINESKSPKPENILEVQNIPSEINSDQEFEVSVQLVADPDKIFFLKGAFKKEGSSNYFGQTFVDSEWIQNNASATKQYKATTNGSGKWEGKLKVKPDIDDSGFDGSGDYIFKIGKYNESGSGLAWSNDTKIKINFIEKIEKVIMEEDGEEISETPEPEFSESIVSTIPQYNIRIASVAGVSAMSDNITQPEIKVLDQKEINWFFVSGGVLIFILSVGLLYLKLKKGN